MVDTAPITRENAVASGHVHQPADRSPRPAIRRRDHHRGARRRVDHQLVAVAGRASGGVRRGRGVRPPVLAVWGAVPGHGAAAPRSCHRTRGRGPAAVRASGRVRLRRDRGDRLRLRVDHAGDRCHGCRAAGGLSQRGIQFLPRLRGLPADQAPRPAGRHANHLIRSLGKGAVMSREDVLVSTAWAEENLDTPGIVFVEVDEDTSAYDKGHIRNAVKIDWKNELQDPVRRDFVDKAGFEKLLSEKGIANDDTVVLYGGNNNWFAAYAYWYFKLYGHEKLKLLDGGRKKWELE